ncbi:uncharacterized protein [Rutidosis leptorrhynchoides]|uniref:uncharacterized protein isoform X1 n=1 Tax=Rutidosis leptorrhynchoides TaxID=125765 RepID=UPI003A98EEC3
MAGSECPKDRTENAGVVGNVAVGYMCVENSGEHVVDCDNRTSLLPVYVSPSSIVTDGNNVGRADGQSVPTSNVGVSAAVVWSNDVRVEKQVQHFMSVVVIIITFL